MASGDNVVEIDEHDGMTATEAGLEMFQKFGKFRKKIRKFQKVGFSLEEHENMILTFGVALQIRRWSHL